MPGRIHARLVSCGFAKVAGTITSLLLAVPRRSRGHEIRNLMRTLDDGRRREQSHVGFGTADCAEEKQVKRGDRYHSLMLCSWILSIVAAWNNLDQHGTSHFLKVRNSFLHSLSRCLDILENRCWTHQRNKKKSETSSSPKSKWMNFQPFTSFVAQHLQTHLKVWSLKQHRQRHHHHHVIHVEKTWKTCFDFWPPIKLEFITMSAARWGRTQEFRSCFLRKSILGIKKNAREILIQELIWNMIFVVVAILVVVGGCS